MAEQAPIIIKKIKKGGHGGHHGGAWKIAYADFVTAMMAFFLLMWLLNAVTEEQLEGISNYFAPVSASQSTSGAGGVLGGQTVGEEGAIERSTSRPSVTMNLPPPKAGSGEESDADEGAEETAGEVSEDDADEALREAEEVQFEEAENELKEAIENVPSLKNLAQNLLIDNTPEGLRIQLIDREGLAMFPSGSSNMYLHTKKIMELVSKIIQQMPQKISISGHTDASKFVTDTGYSNWELSSDRANSARRALMDLKIPENRVHLVVGKAATDPLFADKPEDPRNRRLSIILLRGTGDQKLPKTDKIKKAVKDAEKAGVTVKEEDAPGDEEGKAPAKDGETTPPPASPGDGKKDGEATTPKAETPAAPLVAPVRSFTVTPEEVPEKPKSPTPTPDTVEPTPPPAKPAAPASAPATPAAAAPAAPTTAAPASPPAGGSTNTPRTFTIDVGPAPTQPKADDATTAAPTLTPEPAAPAQAPTTSPLSAPTAPAPSPAKPTTPPAPLSSGAISAPRSFTIDAAPEPQTPTPPSGPRSFSSEPEGPPTSPPETPAAVSPPPSGPLTDPTTVAPTPKTDTISPASRGGTRSITVPLGR